MIEIDWIRDLTTFFRGAFEEYYGLMIYISTHYGHKIPIGTAWIARKIKSEKQAQLAKFYVSKVYRKPMVKKYEEKAMLAVLSYVFELFPGPPNPKIGERRLKVGTPVEKVIVSINASNIYFIGLFKGYGFKLASTKVGS
jgi:hypothetical protein